MGLSRPLRQIKRAVETGSSVGSSYVDALAYAVSSCVTEPSWRRGVRHGAGQPAPRRLMPRCLAVPQRNRVAEVPWGVLIRGWGAGPALGARYRATFGQAGFDRRLTLAPLRSHRPAPLSG